MELQQLAADYWARADWDPSVKMETLFTDDAVLVLGALHLDGRTAIDKFFRDRDATHLAAQRITRHLGCNFRATPIDDSHALVRTTVLVYAGTGELPLPSGPPTGLADFEDICVRATTRPWLF